MRLGRRAIRTVSAERRPQRGVEALGAAARKGDGRRWGEVRVASSELTQRWSVKRGVGSGCGEWLYRRRGREELVYRRAIVRSVMSGSPYWVSAHHSAS